MFVQRRMRGLVVLCLAAVLAAGENDVEQLIGKLAQGDAEAKAQLIAMGPKILPALRARADRPGVRAVIHAITLQTVEFSLGLPKMRLTVGLVNSDLFKVAVRVRNRSGQEMLLWPYFTLAVLDAQGRPLKPTQRIGRWGRRKGDCLLAEIPFAKVAADKHWGFSFLTGIRRYAHDPDFLTGFQVPGPGTYTLRLTYDYDRTTARKRCPKHAEHADDATRPWNRALELKHAFSVRMDVR
jgi:hypothetical protein